MPLNPDIMPAQPTSEAYRRFSQVSEVARERKMEALKLYRPNEVQEAFHRSNARVRIVRGGNRAGKTLSVAAEFASAATGMPIIGQDGKPLPHKYPLDRPLRLWTIGYGQDHIGQTIHRALFRPELFKICRDKETGEWRTHRPWEEPGRKDLQFAPPLIPARFLADEDDWAWENRAERVFRICRLQSGTEIVAFTSKGEPKQGDPVDLVWIDEDVAFSDHLSEWLMRLVDNDGHLIWSAMPHESNDALVNFCDQAEAQAKSDSPTVREFQLTLSGNRFIADKTKQEILSLLSPEERLRRDLGEFNREARLVFPSFSPAVHGMDQEEWRDKYKEGQGWCRYMSVDPGISRCAVSFWAVSPPEVHPEIIVLEDELYLSDGNPVVFAQGVADRIAGRAYQRFIIDMQQGRKRENSGMTIAFQYGEQLAKRGVKSVETSHGFCPGSTDIEARVTSFRKWLMLRDDGTPLFRYLRGKAPNFVMEMGKYRRRKGVQGVILDIPDDTKFSDLMVTAQYFAASLVGRQHYYKPPAVARAKTPIELAWEEKKRRRRKHNYVNLGPEETSSFEYV